MVRVHPDMWRPVGVDSIETAADTVVRSRVNTLVTAGPGAGKTELLAQRSSYLLTTGECPYPYRILAISFKRDAAKNLADRVLNRCGKNAMRFDSMTLDAFAKGLVDRFLYAIPENWRPNVKYEVLVESLRTQELREWFIKANVNKTKVNQATETDIRQTFEKISHGFPLPYDGKFESNMYRELGLRWWREQINQPSELPSVTFPMLNRLAEYLLVINPKIKTALRAAYKYVFLDEFQDTTTAQYDLLRIAFSGSESIVTAVGDGKQRIMLWAGAKPDVFDVFKNDFRAEQYNLVRNYRSAPQLVQIQQIIMQSVEIGTPRSVHVRSEPEGSCTILEFNSPESEADYLSGMIERGINENGLKSRDFCILVRQRTADMILNLQTTLSNRGIRIRDESRLQDLLVDPVVNFILFVFRLALKIRDPEAWERLREMISIVHKFEEFENGTQISNEANKLIQYVKVGLSENRPLLLLIKELVSMIGENNIMSVFRQYAHGTYLQSVINEFTVELQRSVDATNTLCEAIDDFIGSDIIPAMTIHKSKGLEFHTVIFIGLEDSQWWNFSNQADEEKRSFFVAFSRAIAQVYFTFCDVRDSRWGGRRPQNRSQISDLYSILQQAGVQTVRIE